jgi:hypothetical protein
MSHIHDETIEVHRLFQHHVYETYSIDFQALAQKCILCKSTTWDYCKLALRLRLH